MGSPKVSLPTLMTLLGSILFSGGVNAQGGEQGGGPPIYLHLIFDIQIIKCKLTTNMRVQLGNGSEHYSKFLLNIGEGRFKTCEYDNENDYLHLPKQWMSRAQNIEQFVKQV